MTISSQSFILIAVIMLVLDSVYLSAMKRPFSILVQSIQHSPMTLRTVPIVLCYCFLLLLFYYFLIYKQGTILDAFLLGVGTYGVYETTNFAIFKQWNNISISILDTLWGGVLLSCTLYIHNMVMR